MPARKLIPFAAAALVAGCTAAPESEEVSFDTAAIDRVVAGPRNAPEEGM